MTEGSSSPQSLGKSSEQGEKGGVRRPIFHKNKSRKIPHKHTAERFGHGKLHTWEWLINSAFSSSISSRINWRRWRFLEERDILERSPWLRL